MSPATSVEACNGFLSIHLDANVAIHSAVATHRTIPDISKVICYWKYFWLLWKPKRKFCSRLRKHDGCFHWHCNNSQYITMLIVNSWRSWIHIVVNKNYLKSTVTTGFFPYIKDCMVTTYQSQKEKTIKLAIHCLLLKVCNFFIRGPKHHKGSLLE